MNNKGYMSKRRPEEYLPGTRRQLKPIRSDGREVYNSAVDKGGRPVKTRDDWAYDDIEDSPAPRPEQEATPDKALSAQKQPEATTYETLGAEVPFDPESAKKAREATS